MTRLGSGNDGLRPLQGPRAEGAWNLLLRTYMSLIARRGLTTLATMRSDTGRLSADVRGGAPYGAHSEATCPSLGKHLQTYLSPSQPA